METVVKLCDFHVPYQSDKTISVALKLCKHIKPKIVVLDEVIDFYSLSKFNKDPKRKTCLQNDLNTTYAVLSKIRKALPETRMVMVESNHDKRLQKYLNSKAEELSQLDCLKFEKLLKLDKLDIEYRKDFFFRGVLFKHGDLIRKHSAYTAKAELEKEGVNGVSGHTHRLSMHFKTLRGGDYVWLEGGCLCKTKNIEYIDGCANWQQGLSIFMFKDGKKSFQPKIIPIISNEILWGSHVFKA